MPVRKGTAAANLPAAALFGAVTCQKIIFFDFLGGFLVNNVDIVNITMYKNCVRRAPM
jgi:hypothetical protein